MLKKPVISIVDDDPLILRKSMGFIAETFQRAVDLLKSDRLHSTTCLIADVQMPGMTGRELQKVDRNRDRRRHMKFVLVNGRIPRPQSFCALCCEPIGESYLRDIATRLSYCEHKCYVDHCKVAVPALQYHARAS
jgi:hypothetical protein